MDARTLPIFFLLLTSVVIDAWQSEDEYSDRGLRRGIHYHSKRHMLVRENERKRRITTQKPKELRKKPTGNLKPIQADEMEDFEVVSVAVGPPVRPKYDKVFKHLPKSTNHANNYTNTNVVVNLVKDVIAQIGREFLTRPLSEDFIFGQYVGLSIKNLTRELKLKIQHEILDLIVKYQKISFGDGVSITTNTQLEEKTPLPLLKEIKLDKKFINDTADEGWPDFKNLAKIVG
ncbi:unnamed protein product, partial [Brenthis ino]